MKTHLKWLALLAALLAAAAGQAQIVETNAATIRAGVVRGIPGSTVSVPFSLTHTGAVSALQFDINYGAGKFSVGTFQPASLSNNIILRSRQVGPGQHRILVYNQNLTLLSTNTELGALPFTVPAGDLGGGGGVGITNALAATPGALSAEPLRLVHGAVLVGPVFRGSDGVVDLFLTVQSNRTYVIQATTNFVNWVNLSTNFATLNYIIHRDIQAVAYSMRFYRAMPVQGTAGSAIGSVAMNAGGFITFNYPTLPGRSYALQSSTNLINWSDTGTNLAAALSLSFTNLIDPAYPQRYFRVVELP